jgi:NAD(P)-dependent dehydrogenase (short-subunit alcohol dehydrogenase family)
VGLEDKFCLITGAGSGIGQAMARLFAKDGARVVVADQTVAEIRGTGGEAGIRIKPWVIPGKRWQVTNTPASANRRA